MSDQTNLIPINDPSEIPENLSDEEELEFWDTHYMTEAYLDKVEEVPKEERPQARSSSKQINVRMDESTIERLKKLADDRGVGYQTLMKDFVKERLYEEELREGVISRGEAPLGKALSSITQSFPSVFKHTPTLGTFLGPWSPPSTPSHHVLHKVLGSSKPSNEHIVFAIKHPTAFWEISRGQIGNLGDITIARKRDDDE